MRHNKTRGFSLMELMVTVAIVAILAAIAYPAYQDQVRKTRRADGQAKLVEIMNQEERWFTQSNTYTADLTDLGYAASAPSEKGFYLVTAAACGGGIGECVTLTAAPQAPQDKDTFCASLTLSSTGVQGESGTASSANQCW